MLFLYLLMLFSFANSSGVGDINGLKNITSLVQKNASLQDIEKPLVLLAQERTKNYWRQRGFPDSLNPDDKDLAMILKRQLQKDLSSTARSKYEELAVSITTGSWSEDFYASLLELPLKKDLSSANRRFYSKATSNSSYFRGNVSKSSLLKDQGLEGSRNGVVDLGERIDLRLAIENHSKKNLFSSSAFVRSNSPYIWVINKEEQELSELDAGQMDYVDAQLYISKQTPKGTKLFVEVQVYDSRYHQSSPATIRYSLPVSHVAKTRLSNVVLDTDMPGFSEKSKSKYLEANQKFEIRSDVFVPSADAFGAQMNYLTPTSFTSSYRNGPMLRVGLDSGVRFEARDDLDVKVPTQSIFEQNKKRYALSKRWTSGTRQYIYIAADTQLILQTGKTKTKSNSSTRASTIRSTPPKKAPTASEVVSLVNKNTSLKPLAPSSAPSDSVSAAHGYYVSFDRIEFTKQYNALLKGSSGSEAVIDEASENQIRELQTQMFSKAEYNYRHYIALPVLMEEKQKTPPPPKKKPKKKPKLAENSTTCSIQAPRTIKRGEVYPIRLQMENYGSRSDLKAYVKLDGNSVKMTLSDLLSGVDIRKLDKGLHSLTVFVYRGQTKICSAKKNLVVEVSEGKNIIRFGAQISQSPGVQLGYMRRSLFGLTINAELGGYAALYAGVNLRGDSKPASLNISLQGGFLSTNELALRLSFGGDIRFGDRMLWWGHLSLDSATSMGVETGIGVAF
ncbi:MAG: hypothetical protein VX278_14150 [Myxococcota bacterium]|nr:hypothetical protein [Myxococcota bacterium]